MNRQAVMLLLAMLVITACSRHDGPALDVSNVRVLAPLPGRSASVAYMDMHNRSQHPLTIDGISSPEFVRAEIHETTLSDGIARMQALESITVDAGARLSFAPAGLHIMLLDPRKGLLPGATVRLELRYSDGGLLIVDAPVRTRGDDVK
ncbi:MAG: copper chaperone PCu(A)C [Gammaproteobacteria bacterium]|nr:copper chaperone PCu(A)C [Gammaproteobacteria bacterium]MDH4314799.1 copper chaperone PCu(A)C [Gammaproteobacteria bacterium]MDH5213074.1 copper chaperone PCu(A)C [Gammaproteobacteria bacterium]MDH5500179.1 copper chaperone PCu(A)C [Gammaproteobacteria bacterium]